MHALGASRHYLCVYSLNGSMLACMQLRSPLNTLQLSSCGRWLVAGASAFPQSQLPVVSFIWPCAHAILSDTHSSMVFCATPADAPPAPAPAPWAGSESGVMLHELHTLEVRAELSPPKDTGACTCAAMSPCGRAIFMGTQSGGVVGFAVETLVWGDGGVPPGRY